jgi:hypothetical protein
MVTAVVPSTGSAAGAGVVTINGANFGRNGDYSVNSPGGASSSISNSARAEVVTRGAVPCSATVWVSDTSVTCTLPSLPLTRQSNLNVAARTVSAAVAVTNPGGGRSDPEASSAAFVYTNGLAKAQVLADSIVPIFYSCDNSLSDAVSRSACFTCCRSNCVQDEFNQVLLRFSFLS